MALGTLTQPDPVPARSGDPLPHWKQLAALPEDELGRLDLAFVQFVTNMGLPGSERLDPHGCLRILHAWADRVGRYTARQLRRFRRDPARYENSEAYFRALCLATVLQNEFGVRYDPAKVPREVPFELEDRTVQGAVTGAGGTCASLPVLYAAVGRHLGYPIKLAAVFVDREVLHLIARWDGGGARFNIEATGTGLATPPDDHYRRGKYTGTPELERQGRFLQSQTPRMELAGFLQERARYCRRVGKSLFAAEALAWAFALDPTNAVAEDYLRIALNEWTHSVEGRRPPGFPELSIRCPRRFFPAALPLHYERQIVALMSAERLLGLPERQGDWERMRRGGWSGRGPNRAVIEFRSDGSCEVRVELNP